MWASAPAVLVATRFLWPIESCCRCRADSSSASTAFNASSRKKVVVVGAGWAGLASAHHLCKQVWSGSSCMEPEEHSIYANLYEVSLNPFMDYSRASKSPSSNPGAVLQKKSALKVCYILNSWCCLFPWSLSLNSCLVLVGSCLVIFSYWQQLWQFFFSIHSL